MVKVFGSAYVRTMAWIKDSVVANDLSKADIVLLPGGGDWNPRWYNEPIGSTTIFANPTDIREMKILIEAMKENKLIVGICRGLQGIHIAAGGKLIQNVTFHRSDHDIVDLFTGDIFSTNSLHHQMVYLESLAPEKYSLIAKSYPNRSTIYTDGYNLSLKNKDGVLLSNDPDFQEPEVVYYFDINALGFQYHPEMLFETSHCYKYSRSIVEEMLSMRSDGNKQKPYIDNMEYMLKEIEKFGARTFHQPLLPLTTQERTETTDVQPTQKHEKEPDWRSRAKKL